MSQPEARTWRSDLVIVGVAGVVYYLVSRWTLAAHLGPGDLAGVWPQCGVALAAMLRVRRQLLVALVMFVAHAAASLGTDMAAPRALGFGLVGAIEPLVAAWVLRRARGEPVRLASLRDVAALLLLAAGLANGVTALVGAAVATAGTATPFWSAWWVWWIADGLGMVVVGALLLSWTEPADPAPRGARAALELGLSCGLLLALGLAHGAHTPAVVFPLLLWPALRFGTRGASAALATLTAAVMLSALSAGEGPQPAVAAQGILCIAAVCTLVPAAVMVDHRHALTALRRSEEHQARAQQVAHLGQWVRALDGPRDEWSDELFRLLGASPGEVAPGAGAFLARVDPEPGGTVARAMAGEGPDLDLTLATRGGPHPADTTQRGPDPAARWLLVRTRLLRDADGRARRVVGTFLDVTATLAAQRALEESQQRYRTLFEHAPIGLGVADLTGRLLAWNRAMMEPGGYTDEDIVRIGNVAALYASAEERAAALAIAVRDGRLDRHEVRFRRKDGTTYDALMTLRPITVDGQRCWLAMSEDLTAKKQAEEAGRRLQAELQHARRMETVGVFAAGVAHDFNNLLTAIYGYCDLAARRAGDDATLREALDGTRAAADQASAITRSLLAFSRKVPPVRRPLDLGAAAREGTRLLRTHVLASVTLTVDAAPDVWIEADVGQVHQVLMNLLLNACEAMPQGGRLTISVRREAPGPLGGPTALLVVEDTGVGIPDEVRERVFEPFFTTRTRERGTGLGLSVVHGVVTSLGGRVLVDSAVGRGTKMTVALPACAPVTADQAHAAKEAAASPPAGRRGTALVAEDDPLVRRALEEGLREAGFDVRSAGDGAAALALLDEARDLAVAVLDLDLPARSGASCLREARGRGVRVPALLVSGNLAQADLAERDELTRVLEKPFDLARLREAVEDLLDGAGR